MGEEGDGKSLTGTLDRGLAVLEFLAERGECTVGEVSGSLRLSRSTTYRLIDALREREFVSSVPGSAKVGLGIKAVEIGLAAVSRVDIIKWAPAVMRGLAGTGLGTVFLAVPDGDSMVYVAKEDGPQTLNLSARLGSRRPLHCTALGKAYLSALPADERAELVRKLRLSRQTANTITDSAELEEELVRTVERGYAIDAVENEEGVACVAAPVRDYRGRPIAAISVAGVAGKILADTPALGRRIAESALSLSRELGYVGRLRDARENAVRGQQEAVEVKGSEDERRRAHL